MTWRYVPARKTHGGETSWGIHEYYDDVLGAPAWTAVDIAPHAETLDELQQDLRNMLADATRATHFIDLDANPPGLRPIKEAR